jgi:hypothetical protein
VTADLRSEKRKTAATTLEVGAEIERALTDLLSQHLAYHAV